MPHSFRKTISVLVTASLLGVSMAPAQAAMVGTQHVLAAEQGRLDRAQLASLLEREDVQRQLAAMGVDIKQAKERVASLTDAEIKELNQRMGSMPAGGDSVLGIVVLIFLILIITDLVGWTDVFPFVHPIK